MGAVAVVTRKDIFLKKGFSVVDTAQPDFELLALKFDQQASDPAFRDMAYLLEKI